MTFFRQQVVYHTVLYYGYFSSIPYLKCPIWKLYNRHENKHWQKSLNLPENEFPYTFIHAIFQFRKLEIRPHLQQEHSHACLQSMACHYLLSTSTTQWSQFSVYCVPDSVLWTSPRACVYTEMPTLEFQKKGDFARKHLRDRAPHGRGSRGSLKGPWWGPGATPRWGSAPRSSWVSTAF